MGVLDARIDAEKVGYPVVGEEAKEASNVIDYNINEEITKDASAVFNANNSTTTGMATVIPGINAPKLIASTSIYGIPEADPGFIGGCKTKFLGVRSDGDAYEEVTQTITTLGAITDEWGPYKFKYSPNKGLIIPADGNYTIDCFYVMISGSGTVYMTFKCMVGNSLEHTSAVISGGEGNETFVINGYKGKAMYFDVVLKGYPYSWSCTPQVWCTITKN